MVVQVSELKEFKFLSVLAIMLQELLSDRGETYHTLCERSGLDAADIFAYANDRKIIGVDHAKALAGVFSRLHGFYFDPQTLIDRQKIGTFVDLSVQNSKFVEEMGRRPI
ncbi:hypothetical protein B0181_11800 [Moraxella caviae]|uniref:XRE family transcriptional regulator n=1 Tax=Moraxella caviae TaxID=34060 RepID=A0A1S9ZQP5_9GAMM|nr:hypothetical protein [Moraxella caviae]OOR85922.1 hypothetical protein B0181_11800 [Moraxella caviae]STZ13555.1 Uncharacterised protein [Moraxella caviae]VEW13195.1 Uncharacterised protein [Moraxella caviae]